ncbi:MAG: hypothetical protein QOD28_3969 [Acidobacteriota bacterium]|nr:hypothetical protein [Acidobacteriota bacterium]
MPVEPEAVGQAEARVEGVVGEEARVRRPRRRRAREQVEGRERDERAANETQRRPQWFVLSELSQVGFDRTYTPSNKLSRAVSVRAHRFDFGGRAVVAQAVRVERKLRGQLGHFASDLRAHVLGFGRV